MTVPSGEIHEACGVVAIASQKAEPARLAFFALYALQHRGQESAGIRTADGHSRRNLTRMRHVLDTLSGAFCLVMLTRDRVYAARDPWGIRPLVLGRLPDGWAVASESCALDTIGAQLIREVLPGELLAIDRDGIKSEQFSPLGAPARAGCSFEFIYFARPDSLI